MPPSSPRSAPSFAVDLSPLVESRDFRLLWSGQLVSMVGRQITVVALPYQVFQLTRSTLAVGLVGLAQVVPLIGFSLLGGALADRVDRRRLLLVSNCALATCSAGYTGAALAGQPPVAVLYAIAAVAAGFSAIDQPTRTATIPNLVPRHLLAPALALSFVAFEVTLIGGPALGGLVIAHVGLPAAYAIDVATFVVAIAAIAGMRPQPPAAGARESPLAAIRTGLAFARRQPAILGGFAIDLDAMVFGMPRALFPALAQQTFHVGAQGLGLLYAAPAAGAALAALLATGWVGRVARLGRVVVASVVVWGLAIVGFGLATEIGVALTLLAVAGAADSVSAVCRTTMLQTLTPDALRGRMSATYSMVVVGGPYLGDVEAGAVAARFGVPVSVISGGAACVVGAAVVAVAMPALWHYRGPTSAATAVRPAVDPGVTGGS